MVVCRNELYRSVDSRVPAATTEPCAGQTDVGTSHCGASRKHVKNRLLEVVRWSLGLLKSPRLAADTVSYPIEKRSKASIAGIGDWLFGEECTDSIAWRIDIIFSKPALTIVQVRVYQISTVVRKHAKITEVCQINGPVGFTV